MRDQTSLRRSHQVITARSRKPIYIVTAIVLLFCLLTSFVVYRLNTVTVIEDGKTVTKFTTVKSSEQDLIAQSGIKVTENDAVSLTWDNRSATLKIDHAFPIEIECGEEKLTIMATVNDTVETALKNAGIQYSADDGLSADPKSKVSKDTKLSLSYRTRKSITVKETIEYDVETKKTDKLYVGETQIEQKGKNGECEMTYSVLYENGEEISRTLEQKTVTAKPRTCIKLIGTKQKKTVQEKSETKQSSGSSKNITGKKVSDERLANAKVLIAEATAYTHGSTGGDITCFGIRPYRGIVAVDPDVIPLGTEMYITSLDGSYVYGYCVAGDTGGGMKGNRIDLFMDTGAECNTFGRQMMKVCILK